MVMQTTTLYDFFAPMWVELSFLVFFALGFLFLRFDNLLRSPQKQKGAVDDTQSKLRKKLEADVSIGQNRSAVDAWRAVRSQGPTQVETLKIVVQALASSEPEALHEVVDHMAAHPTILSCPRVATAVLDIVARTGHVGTMEGLSQVFRQKMRIAPTPQTYEVLLGGYASVGDEKKVQELCDEIRAANQKLTARGYSLTIKGFLKNSMGDAALQHVMAMRHAGFYVPPFAVTQLLRVACDTGRTVEIFDRAKASGVFETSKATAALPAEAVAVLLDDCCKRNDVELASRVQELASESGTQLLTGAFDSLLKTYVVAGDARAITLFEDMQRSGARISEGLCVGLLARAADSKFLRFAEEVVTFVRERDGMSIVVYSALMKVYAYSGLYDKACDLYDQIKADGLEPDSMMYGCLMKFAAECGRTELSRTLSERSPTLDVQNYMSLIRAAGRDKDVERAFSVLQRLRDSGVAIDLPAYNCVLDVCVSVGDMKRAKQLIEQMKGSCHIDIITHNTLLKGYCNVGDISGAKAWLQEMERSGNPPNDVSYNCLINAAISTGRFNDAWETITMMQSNNVPVDHYTISIMMKSLKKARNPKQVVKTLELLDSSGIDVCSDEILLNTVVETCIWHKQYQRLEQVLQSFHASGLRPSVPTYGSLIKACSAMNRIDRCWVLWRQIVEERGMEPSDIVLGCMLDALVCNDSLEAAVQLLGEWKGRVKPNTVMYSTIIKGFASTRQSSRAMDMWREMLALKIPMNTVAYNALIDAQARVGAMEEVEILVTSMEPNGCTPDVITFSTIVKGYCVKGELYKALEVFEGIERNGMVADAIIYNTILDGCIRHNNMELADQLVGNVDKYKVTPSNFTVGILVKMYGRRGQLEEAFKVVNTLPKQFGFAPNAQVLTCLMCACVNNRAIPRAFAVFEDLKRSREGADVRAYGALLSGCVRHGHLEEAAQLVEEAYGLKDGKPQLSPRENIEAERLEQLFRSLAQKGLQQKVGVPLMAGLQAKKVPVNFALPAVHAKSRSRA
jgi:pentatricopeptide repeat protein